MGPAGVRSAGNDRQTLLPYSTYSVRLPSVLERGCASYRFNNPILTAKGSVIKATAPTPNSTDVAIFKFPDVVLVLTSYL